ncbi:MAG: VCBS repeat-containing protein [Planctomycetaceae bacterium]
MIDSSLLRRIRLACVAGVIACGGGAGDVRAVEPQSADPIPFEIKLLTVDANEGCDVADVDGDGKLDVIAGRNWYRNPDWAPRPLRYIPDWNGYVESNCDFAVDVNGDGRVDVVSGSFIPTQVHWYENPGEEGLRLGQYWKQHQLVDTGYSQNEGTFLHDIDGDGRPEWISNSWNKSNPQLVWSFGAVEEQVEVKEGNQTVTRTVQRPTLIRHTIGESGNGHGVAFGDFNNDGREDIVVSTGWYERPEGNPFAGEWTWHPRWPDLHASCPMLIRDLDGDGINDLIWGKGHEYGLFVWWGKGVDDKGEPQFEEELIDDSYSQPHTLHFADLDGDGKDELLTGKRVRAHNGNDPGGKEPPILCYYSFDAGTKKFTRHIINEGQVGTGLQFRTVDLDGDGDIDIVKAGKEGTHILWNLRK